MQQVACGLHLHQSWPATIHHGPPAEPSHTSSCTSSPTADQMVLPSAWALHCATHCALTLRPSSATECTKWGQTNASYSRLLNNNCHIWLYDYFKTLINIMYMCVLLWLSLQTVPQYPTTGLLLQILVSVSHIEFYDIICIVRSTV